MDLELLELFQQVQYQFAKIRADCSLFLQVIVGSNDVASKCWGSRRDLARKRGRPPLQEKGTGKKYNRL